MEYRPWTYYIQWGFGDKLLTVSFDHDTDQISSPNKWSGQTLEQAAQDGD